jgi:urease accessory protein
MPILFQNANMHFIKGLKFMNKNFFKLVVFITFATISNISNAHVEPEIAVVGSFITGLIHPLSGLDHLLAMLSVGLWAGQNQGKILWMTPLTFMIFMIIGSIIGIMNFNLPISEYAILLSLIVFGSLTALSIRSNITIAMLIIGTFALFHGYSHGTEMSKTASAFQYIIGFVITTGLLHITGIAISKIFLLRNKIIMLFGFPARSDAK